MTPATVSLALLLLGLLLLVAKWIRVRWRLAQNLFLPSSIIAGGLALFFGPEVFGAVAGLFGVELFEEGGLWTQGVLDVWVELPELLITVVFASLFLGTRLPRPKDAVKLAGPQIVFGATLGVGQYVVGLLLALLVLTPVFGLPPMSGALIEIGFEGGHGTAAGLGSTFDDLGFAEGQDLALGLATVGLLSGVVFGIVAINWGARAGKATQITPEDLKSTKSVGNTGIVALPDRGPAATMTVHPSSLEPLMLHVGVLAAAILLGQLALSGLQLLEQWLWADTMELFAFVPLFPLAMLGGIVVQILIDRFDHRQLVDRLTMERMQGLSLDLLITSALGTLVLSAIAANIGPFLLLAGTGLLWCGAVFFFLAPRMIPSYWLERGVGDFGQSLGTTATGLVLMRIADPELRTPAYEAFGYKQLVVEPFIGGGLVTAAALPLIAQFGPYPFLAASATVLAVALFIGLTYFSPRRSTMLQT